jgi:hypothetical protein
MARIEPARIASRRPFASPPTSVIPITPVPTGCTDLQSAPSSPGLSSPRSGRGLCGLRAACCRFRQAACCREATPQAPNTETFSPSLPAFHLKYLISSLLSLISLPRQPAPSPSPLCPLGEPMVHPACAAAAPILKALPSRLLDRRRFGIRHTLALGVLPAPFRGADPRGGDEATVELGEREPAHAGGDLGDP